MLYQIITEYGVITSISVISDAVISPDMYDTLSATARNENSTLHGRMVYLISIWKQ